MSANGSVHGPLDLETAWKEECAAAERLREAQTAAAKAAHELSIRQHERQQLENAFGEPQPHSVLQRTSRLQTWSVAVLIAIGSVGFAYWGWAETSVLVCSTSMTATVADHLLRAYSNFPYHYALAADSAGRCDVRFYATTSPGSASLIARDGVVAIVNPSTPVHELTAAQLRDIFTGHITNWSKAGAPAAPIVAMVPPDGSDEARVAKAFLNDDIASSVRRSSASEIVKFVTSASGKHAIGFVPFSAAASAKVVTIAGAPQPTSSSIAHDQYPLAIELVAESDDRNANAGASSLVAFARTHRLP